MTIRYLLDTSVMSDVVRHPRGRVAARIAGVGDDAIAISVIVAAELRYGAAKKGSLRLVDRVEAILATIPVLPFEPGMDRTYADLRTTLERAGQPIGGNDLLIAAHAMSAEFVLVTDNVREFARIAGLRVENWLRDDP